LVDIEEKFVIFIFKFVTDQETVFVLGLHVHFGFTYFGFVPDVHLSHVNLFKVVFVVTQELFLQKIQKPFLKLGSPRLPVFDQQFANCVLRRTLDACILGFLLKYLFVHFEGVVAVERTVARDHFLEETAELPLVHSEVDSLFKVQLGRRVLRQATYTLGDLVAARGRDLLAEFEVHQLQLAVRVDVEVFGTQCAINDVRLVQEGQRLHQVDGPILDQRLVDGLDLAQEQKKVATHTRFEHNVELAFVLGLRQLIQHIVVLLQIR